MKSNILGQRLWSSQYEQPIACDHKLLSELILEQWNNITLSELQETGYDKRKIAGLIEKKYRVHHVLMENYLSNLERTLPLVA